MKTSIKTFSAAIALTALMAGPAAAMVSPSDLYQDINSAIAAGSNVSVNVVNDVVTLTGYFADAADKSAALSAANANPSVDRVIDLTTISN